MVATRSSKKPQRPASARRHAFVTNTSGGLSAFETALLFGAQAAYGDDDAHRSLAKNRWLHDAEHSTDEVAVFHKGRDTMTTFRGSVGTIGISKDWRSTNRKIVTGTISGDDERFFRNYKIAEGVMEAYPRQRHSYAGHSLGGAIAHYVHRALDGHQSAAFNPATSAFKNDGLRETMKGAAKLGSKNIGQNTPAAIAKKITTHRVQYDLASLQAKHSYPGSMHKEHQVALKHGQEIGHSLKNLEGHFHPAFIQAE